MPSPSGPGCRVAGDGPRGLAAASSTRPGSRRRAGGAPSWPAQAVADASSGSPTSSGATVSSPGSPRGCCRSPLSTLTSWRCCARPCRRGPAWGPAPGAGVRRAGRAERGRPREAGERVDLLQRLLALCRAVPDECRAEAAAVCTVAAHVAWVEGDGALARAALDRALRLVPDYRLALLLERLVDAGLRLPRRPGPGDDGPLLSRAG